MEKRPSWFPYLLLDWQYIKSSGTSLDSDVISYRYLQTAASHGIQGVCMAAAIVSNKQCGGVSLLLKFSTFISGWLLKFNGNVHIQRHISGKIFMKIRSFLQRVGIAGNADRCNSYSDSVRLSVHPSVTFRFLFRRMKVRSCGFQDHVGQSF